MTDINLDLWPDILIVAQTVFGEARGETFEGMVAVAWVIRNRVEIDLGNDGKPDWWGEGFSAVCLKPKQFSCWNKGDPNLPRIFAEFKPMRPQSRRGVECLYAAVGVLLGRLPDPTNGSTHYCTIEKPAWAALWPPAWARGIKPVAIVGNHQFYRGVK